MVPPLHSGTHGHAETGERSGLIKPGSDPPLTNEDLALTQDRADVRVLGCAGMADLAADISAVLGVPVVDGATAATRTVESLVALGLRTSAREEYASPPAKTYTGLPGQFAVL